MSKNTIIGSMILLILFSFAIYDGVNTKTNAKKEIITTLSKKGYNVEKVEVDISSGRAKVYTTKKLFYIDSIYAKNLAIYEKEYLD